MTECRRVTGCADSHVGGNGRFACTQCRFFKIVGEERNTGNC